MKRIVLLAFFIFSFVTLYSQIGNFVNGWTVIEPSVDSKVVYVSNSTGSDQNTGLTESDPLKSIEKAASLVRAGYPDHILLRCGDVWTKPNLNSFKSGRSANEPMVISYYGDSIKRPQINIEGPIISLFGNNLSNLAIIGIHFYAYRHDPTSEKYSSELKVVAMDFVGQGDNILIEDCLSDYAQLAAFDHTNDSYFFNINLRRNIIRNAWAGDTYTIHELYNRVQGFYASEVDSLLIEENIFDHNGWNDMIPNAGPNMFVHNVYLQGNTRRVVFRNNISARAAAHGLQLRGGGVCHNNLFYNNAVQVNVGYDFSTSSIPQNPPMIPWISDKNNTKVSDNVILATRQMDSSNTSFPRTPARAGIWQIIIPSIIENNIIANSVNIGGTAIDTVYTDLNNIGGEVDINDNIVYKFYSYANISDFETKDPGWIDPERELSDYHQYIGKEASVEAFMNEAAKRPLKTWWEEYSADSVNKYFRTGFSVISDDIPPSAPSTINYSELSDVSVDIVWDYGWDNIRTNRYNVYVDGIKLNTSDVYSKKFRILGLSPETNYEISVKSVDVAGNESDSGITLNLTTLATDTQPPSKPTNTKVSKITHESAKLSWGASTDNYTVLGYNIYLEDNQLNDEIILDTVYDLEDLTNGTEYNYFIEALDPAGNKSARSEAIHFYTIDNEDPTIPGNFTYTTDDNSISLQWDKSTDNLFLAGYIIYLDNDSVDFVTTNQYTISGLTAGQVLSVKISAIDSSGNESRSTHPVTITIGINSINVSSENRALVYPAIVKDDLWFSAEKKIRKYKIVDITGKLISEMDYIEGRKHKITVSDLSKGMYMIILYENDAVYTIEKFIKN